MAKPQRRKGGKPKAKGANGNGERSRVRERSEMVEPPDDFVTDAEIEAREREGQHEKRRARRR